MAPFAGAEPLRPGVAAWVLPAGLMGLAALLTPFLAREPSEAEQARECALVAEVARDLGLPRIQGSVGDGGRAVDCRAAFTRAGLALDSPAAPVRIAFTRPRFTAPDSAVLEMDMACGPLCGAGERLTVLRRDGRWVVAAREATWVS